MTARSHVYFLRPVGQQGPIKIGCSGQPIKRLRTVQVWSPVLLELVVAVPAHHNCELFLHRYFIDQHQHGEWFAITDDLQALIDHAVLHGAFPEWVDPPKNPDEFKLFSAAHPRGIRKLYGVAARKAAA